MFNATGLFEGNCTMEENLESFATDIRPLFSESQINCMSEQGVKLGDYDYMSNPNGDILYDDHANARHVYGRLSGTESGRMPLSGSYWSLAMLKIFSDWMREGFQP
ncbi:hypothetical protein P3T43_007187 [Paraburkholderia sp. GAS41]|uniref:hypothetical protein n=1 Tax=Paraburkholderia sp. GAS41 TaxID=3035134 RepID=UPI003D1CCA14